MVIKEMKVEVKVLRGDEGQIEDELIFKEEKVYVLKYKILRIEIIQLHHNLLVARHEERQKATEPVTKNY